MFSLLFIPLLIQALVVSATNTKKFDLKITWQDYAPDGFSRKMLLVNGQSPGPVLEIDQDDKVVVKVHNESPNELTIHYHGLEMKGTPWSDGVPGVTQHPIKPGHSFTYKFTATQYGSFWYHSHFRGQIEDGLYGAIIIHPREDEPNPFHMISEDTHAIAKAVKDVKPVVISDFVHLTSAEKWDMTVAAGIEDSCYDSILFNGKGRVECLDKDVVAENLNEIQKAYLAMVPGGAEFTDKSCLPASALNAIAGGLGNESALLPGTFSGCKETDGQIEKIKISNYYGQWESWAAFDIIGAVNFVSGVFSIDGHDMWVYAMDGSYIEPQKVQAIPVTNGDRYSILIKIKTTGEYKMRFNSNSAPQLITGHAILSVEGYSAYEEVEPYISLVGLPASKEVVVFNQLIAGPYPPSPPAPVADVTFNLSMAIKGASYLWALNESKLMSDQLDEQRPTLFNPQPYIQNNVTISTQLNQWVDLVFVATLFPQPPHPIHKHGSKMYFLGAGTGLFRWNSVEEAIKEIPDQFNLVNPPMRDAFLSTPAEMEPSWAVVRYHAADAGPWLLHCHINNHMVGGMMMVIQDGVDQWPEVPEEYAEYGNGE
ncbi:uncharacterized protein FIESC28_10477 [Fusarium coffeatum]|uniref:Laccase n=1 Tax=Fusarium coffeatum TaxID=231269 RepID=A0A366QSL2_9HYPO|nr:uncharacterized protein FIESC28_10477 [Fusarium coffeatum]RBR07904.1 hypothetical protein FIESC28_10477 [Fusarium coffeatum]